MITKANKSLIENKTYKGQGPPGGPSSVKTRDEDPQGT